jgi:hypothetical protein
MCLVSGLQPDGQGGNTREVRRIICYILIYSLTYEDLNFLLCHLNVVIFQIFPPKISSGVQQLVFSFSGFTD